MNYITRPLTVEAKMRVKNVRREGSQFSASWSSTLDLLERELAHLGVRGEWVMQIDVEEWDLKLNGELRANAKPMSPAVAISIDRKGKPSLLFACGKFPSWKENVRAIALGLEALRKVERYGITQAEEQYTGFGALPPGTPMPAAKMTLDEAEGTLRRYWHGAVSESRDWELLYRRGAKELHPDVGGDPAEFRKLTEARDLLLASAS